MAIRRFSCLTGCRALFAAVLALSTSASEAAQSSVESGAGGLMFAANPSLTIEQQDVLVTVDAITVTYALRNRSQTPQSILISFALPELDANAVSDSEAVLPSSDPSNYVQVQIGVDGQPVQLAFEQRAMALGLDVTASLIKSGLPVFPLGSEVASKIAGVRAADQVELLERGILKEDGTELVPAWALKTVAYWRQTFAPEQITTITHRYRPIAGIAEYEPGTLQSRYRNACVSDAQEKAISRLPTEGGVKPTLTSVTFNSWIGADALGAVRRYRLIIEAADTLTVVATCHQGLKRSAPMQMDWMATDHVPEDDLHILFAR